MLLVPLLLWLLAFRYRVSRGILLYLYVAGVTGLVSIVLGIPGNGAVLVSVLSAARLYKCILYLVLGYLAAQVFPVSRMVRLTALGSVACLATLLASDVLFTPGFPRARWGGAFWHLPTYGFPNTTAVFYVCYL